MLGIDKMKQFIGMDETKNYYTLRTFLKQEAINNDIDIDPRTTSWCSAMMNGCERYVGNHTEGNLMARSWLRYGKEIKKEDAKEGDIVVFDFEHDGTHGHVTYFVKFDDENNTAECIGGNQSNSVKFSAYSQDCILSIRRSQ